MQLLDDMTAWWFADDVADAVRTMGEEFARHRSGPVRSAMYFQYERLDEYWAKDEQGAALPI